MMIDRWKNNLGLKVMAVLFSILLWWTVVNVDDPIDMAKYRVNVQMINTEVVTNQGTSYQVVDNVKKVTVTVRARRKILSAIRTSDIVATADFREMQGTTVKTVPIRVSIDGYEGEYEDATANPRNLQVQVETIGIKQDVSIGVEATGQVSEGYVLDHAGTTANPGTIDISGPQSLLDKIDKVVASVDVSGLSAEKTLEADVIYYDSDGKVVDKTFLTSSCDKNGVTVKVKLFKTKQVRLNFDTSLIRPAEGYIFSNIEIEPQDMEVAGADDVLQTLAQIDIPAEALEKQNISQNEVILVDVSEYLPEGIVLADEKTKTVRVRILVDQIGTKTITIAASSLEKLHASDEFDILFDDAQTSVSLRFSGDDEALNNLTADSIGAAIDLKDCKEEKTYTIKVLVNQMPEGCTYVGETTIKITLKKK